MTPPVPHHVHVKLLLPAVLIGLISMFAFVAFFTSALHDPQPNGIAVAVVGPPATAAQVQHSLDEAVPGGFDVKHYAGEPAARHALTDQEVDGAFLASAQPRLILAGGSGVNTLNALRTAFGAAAGAQGKHLVVEDVAPLPKHDSRGLSAFFSVAGTSIGSLLFATALFFLGGHGAHILLRLRLALIAAFAILAGLVVAIDTDFVVDGLAGAFWGVAGIGALLAATVALLTTAVVRWVGAPGVGLCVLALMLFSLPASGGAVGPEFVPDFYRSVAPALPSHAAVVALRGTVYFGGGGTTGPILVMLAWMSGAILTILAAHGLGRDAPRLPALGGAAAHGAARA